MTRTIAAGAALALLIVACGGGTSRGSGSTAAAAFHPVPERPALAARLPGLDPVGTARP